MKSAGTYCTVPLATYHQSMIDVSFYCHWLSFLKSFMRKRSQWLIHWVTRMTCSLLILLELNCECRHRAMQEVERKTLLQEDGPQHHPFWLTSLPLWGWKLIICWGLAPATKYDTHHDRLVCWPDSMELGECHCFAVVLSSSMEKEQRSIQGLPVLSTTDTKMEGLPIPHCSSPAISSQCQEHTGTFHQLESVGRWREGMC